MPNPYAEGKDYGKRGQDKKKKFPFPETPGGGKAPPHDMKDKTRMQAEEMGRTYNHGMMRKKKGH